MNSNKPRKRQKPLKLREVLADSFTQEEMEFVTTSFDIVGNIAVIEVREEVRHKEQLIGEAILSMHKNITTVCRRDGDHTGTFRTQKLKVIAGVNTKESLCKENGCQLWLDVEECYYSVRSGTERLRVSSLISKRYNTTKQKENILVMFSGIAPFVCAIGKNSIYKSILGVEMNPVAHRYAQRNIEVNKIKNAEVLEGDVRKIVPKLGKTYDRILMPLPKTAEEFLDTALQVSTKGTRIHLYGFLAEEEFNGYKEKIRSICKEHGFRIRISDLVKCGQFSPRTFRICVDFSLL